MSRRRRSSQNSDSEDTDPLKDKHTPVGSEYQVNLDEVDMTKDKEAENRLKGTLIWNPTSTNKEAPKSFLKKTRHELFDAAPLFDIDFYDEIRPDLENIDKDKVLTREQALELFAQHNYDGDSAAAEMKAKGLTWHPHRPQVVIWTVQEVAIFELGMSKYYKKFSRIQKMVESKTKRQCIEFYFYWKGSQRYDNWREDHARGRLPRSYKQTKLPIKEDTGKRDSRLRNLPRLDYNLGVSKKRKRNKQMRRKSQERMAVTPSPPSIFFDVVVIADIDWDRVNQLKRQRIEEKDASTDAVPFNFNAQPMLEAK
mmetsp:Transcript_5963/g.6504  ORF Transcript_5963/g.6504 Transcript_5963/m.6504 type:complete len:311 (-) Transcript_5963:4-936(-)